MRNEILVLIVIKINQIICIFRYKNKSDYLHFLPIKPESSRYLRKSKYLQAEHLRSTFSLTLLVQTKKQPDEAAIRAYLHNLMGELPFFLVFQK